MGGAAGGGALSAAVQSAGGATAAQPLTKSTSLLCPWPEAALKPAIRSKISWSPITTGYQPARAGTSEPCGRSVHSGRRQNASRVSSRPGPRGGARPGPGMPPARVGRSWSAGRLGNRTLMPPSYTGRQTGEPGSRSSVSWSQMRLEAVGPVNSAPSDPATRLASDAAASPPRKAAPASKPRRRGRSVPEEQEPVADRLHGGVRQLGVDLQLGRAAETAQAFACLHHPRRLLLGQAQP